MDTRSGEPVAPRPPLRRSGTNRLVAGVCGGTGRHLGIDPFWIRAAFVILALAWGSGVALYLLAWWMIPDERASPGAARQAASLRGVALILGFFLIGAASAGSWAGSL